MFFCTIRIH